MPDNQATPRSWFDRPLFDFLPFVTGEALLFGLIVAAVLVSRLTDLGVRVMSHDESLHVYFSWLFYQGKGYQYNPMMHGPLQFHLIALFYFLFGDSNFVARLPHALASILTVIMLWKWRRYLGKAGTLVGALLMLISPIMLYYGRYARNEAFVGLFGVLTFYAILRYFETGKARYLFLLTAATVLHFTSKETAFIYTAQALLFLAVYLINKVTRLEWEKPSWFNGFVISLALGLLLFGAGVVLNVYSLPSAPLLFGLGSLALLASAVLLVAGYGWYPLLKERSFDMLLLLGTLVLPQLSALPVKLVGWNPLDYTFTWQAGSFQAFMAQGPVRVALVFFPLLAISIVLGVIWNKKLWLWNALLFYAVYVFFFTTIFSNWQGFFVGIVGSLGYWLVQQGVDRGSQPWYYYLLIQIPIYEFLPFLGSLLAIYFGVRRKSPRPLPEAEPVREPAPDGNLTFPLLAFWAASSLLAFTIAGEKMPWLTFHIALPMILLAAWALGQVIERVDWQAFREKRGPLVTLLAGTFLISLALALVDLLGANPPFQGKTQAQLATSGAFLLVLAVAVGSAVWLSRLLKSWQLRSGFRLATLVLFGLLAVLTARAAFRAAFVNYNNAEEYLVYAHGDSGIQDAMDQIAAISQATTDGTGLAIGYDTNNANQGVSWPLKWYLRDYPNAKPFTQVSSDLAQDAVLLVAPDNFSAVKTALGSQYYQFNFIRMVWPNQDYFDLTWPRLRNALFNPQMRDAIFQIWLNRDYSAYATMTGSDAFTPATWQPSDPMEMFVRKDIAALIWQYGIGQTSPTTADPYAPGTVTLTATAVFGSVGQADGQLNDPHGIAIAPNGNVYVADTNNNRIEEFTSAGTFVRAWGGYADGTTAPAALGLFNQPWGVAVSPDGEYVYVTDTWNHRIQKFTSDGVPVTSWGKPDYGAADVQFGLWGPRGIVVGSDGRVIVSDTGNKRIVVYDANGNFITQFGSSGMGVGQFDEPVGLALDAQGNLYVADTWNLRIQVFAPSADGTSYSPLRQWDVSSWSSQSLENKPFLAIDAQGNVFASDPDMYRMLEFSSQGGFLRAWGDFGTDNTTFGRAAAVALDAQGNVWVTDSGNNRVMEFAHP